MKPLFSVLVILLTIGTLFPCSRLAAAEYHVVIGSFAQESNARRFTASVRNLFEEVSCSYSEHTKLYYVSVLKTPNKEDAQKLITHLKRDKGFTDAWVFMNHEDGLSAATRPVIAYAQGKARFQPTEPTYEAIMPTTSSKPAIKEEDQPLVTVSPISSVAVAQWTFANDLAFIRDVDRTERIMTGLAEANAKILSFVIEDEKGTSIPAEVMLVNFEKAKKIASFEAGEHIAIKGTRPNQMVTFVCERLGYSQETRMFNLDHLSRGRDIVKNKQGVWEIKIKLRRMELHDIAPLNNTIFHRDAAILEMPSANELDELVLMMKSNPEYKIVLHSHTNRNSKRAIKIPTDQSNYFDLTATVQKVASDKTLTKKRGEVVRNYLVSQGVEKKRIHIVAWGSQELYVNPSSKDAADLNERLEIELVD